MEKKKRLPTSAIEQAKKTINTLAKKHGVSEETIRKEMMTAMRSGMENPDPAVRKEWQSVAWRGAEPTVEEFVAWMTLRVEAERKRTE